MLIVLTGSIPRPFLATTPCQTPVEGIFKILKCLLDNGPSRGLTICSSGLDDSSSLSSNLLSDYDPSHGRNTRERGHMKCCLLQSPPLVPDVLRGKRYKSRFANRIPKVIPFFLHREFVNKAVIRYTRRGCRLV